MLKKLLSILLATVLCFSLLSLIACDAKDDAPVDKNEVLWNGFEYFDRDVQLIRLLNEFGKVDQNSNPEYVRSGEKSLKITPLGSRVNNANPYFMIPATSTRFEEISFGDFTKVDKITCWLYNAEDTPVSAGLGFGKGALKMDDRRDIIQKTNVEYFSLNSGWNYIEYDVQPALLKMQGLNLQAVMGLMFEFDYVESHDLKDSPEIYLDDITIKYTDTPKSQEYSTTVKTGTNNGNPYWVISDFENSTDAYAYMYNYAFPAPVAAHPIIKSVFAGDYNVVTEDSLRVLLIQKKHGGGTYGWPVLHLAPEPIKAAIDAIGQDIYDNPYNYVITYDCYNGSNYTGGWSHEFYKGGISTWQSLSVKPRNWAAYSYNIGSLMSAYEKYKTNNSDTDLKSWLDNPHLEFRWSGHYNKNNAEAENADRCFFIDNVRIEKIG